MRKDLLNIYESLRLLHPEETHYLDSVKAFLHGSQSGDFTPLTLQKFLIPEHVHAFDVVWTNDEGEKIINKGYRVQHNNTLGVYKGGIRFAPSVNLDILKALALEQTLKNSLTGLPLGGAKGGSDFDPKGKSDGEMSRFISEFMKQLGPFIGSEIDVPAGDLGVSQREVTMMQKAYEKVMKTKDITFTSKLMSEGGSNLRPEATGYGLIFIVQEALLKRFNETLVGKKIVISGSGNVATHAAYKAIELGAKVVAMSGTSGVISDEKGIDVALIEKIKNAKLPLNEYLKEHKKAKFNPDPKSIWTLKYDIALPCATNDEIDGESVYHLLKNNVLLVSEGSNLALTNEAVEVLVANEVLFLPGKAANAGGVAVSYFEMVQNANKESWTAERVSEELEKVMRNIFKEINEYAFKNNMPFDLRRSAGLVAFARIYKKLP